MAGRARRKAERRFARVVGAELAALPLQVYRQPGKPKLSVGNLLGVLGGASLAPAQPQADPAIAPRPLFRPVSTWGVLPQPSHTDLELAQRKACRELNAAYLERAHAVRAMLMKR